MGTRRIARHRVFLAKLDRQDLLRALALLRAQERHPNESNPAAAQFDGLATVAQVRAEFRRRGWKLPKPPKCFWCGR